MGQRDGRLLQCGDILLEKSGGGELQPVGRVVIFDSGEPAVTSNFVSRLRLDRDIAYPKYIVYLMDHLQRIRVTTPSIKQTTGIQNLDERDYLSSVVGLPTLDEQRAIADFLDAMDERITRFIGARRRMIALLEEQKQAIVYQAVTMGLNSDVPTRPSGIDWLGDIPTHWETTKLGRAIDLLTGFPFESEGFTQSEKDIRLMRGVNVAPGRIRWESVVTWPYEQAREFSAFELKVGDIVLGMDRPIIGSGVRAARLGDNDVPSLLLQRVARIRPSKITTAEYVIRLLFSSGFSQYLEPIFTGISVPHLSPEQIRAFPIALPPLHEQSAIEFLLAQTLRSQQIVAARIVREIELVHEYRTRLIADVVTGKLDVRGAGLVFDKQIFGSPSVVQEQPTHQVADRM